MCEQEARTSLYTGCGFQICKRKRGGVELVAHTQKKFCCLAFPEEVEQVFLTDAEDRRNSIWIVFGFVGVLISKDVIKETKMELEETEINLSPSW